MKQEKWGSDPKQIMTPKDTAKYLGFHLVTIYRLLKQDQIPATKIGGQWRFRKDVLDDWFLQRMKQNPNITGDVI